MFGRGGRGEGQCKRRLAMNNPTKILHSRNVREGSGCKIIKRIVDNVLFTMLEVVLLPELTPDVEALLKKCLQEEVEMYVTTKPGTNCDLCPFRILSHRKHMANHLKRHNSEHMYTASLRSPQVNVIRALYDYRRSLGCLQPLAAKTPDLLHESALLIRKWNAKCSDKMRTELERNNKQILVRVLTKNGPEYWVKERTGTCYRFSRELYYTSQFADLMLSHLLLNQGKIRTTVNALYHHFAGRSVTPGLLPQNREVWNHIAADIVFHDSVKSKKKELLWKAAEGGEFEVVSHDETFKTLFCVIGQRKMSQRQGEVHALHTFRGFTGCTIGVSLQRSTSSRCFKKAVEETFERDLAAKVKFLYSDCPARIFKIARDVFPSLLGVGEDPIHLPIRLEYCWGEKRTEASQRVLELHRKFRVPCHKIVSFWHPEARAAVSTPWPTNISAETRSKDEWKSFCSVPFQEQDGYENYVTELAKIAITYRDLMRRKTAKEILL